MKSKNTLIVAAALLLTAPAFGATPVNDDKNATQTVTVNQETIGRIVSEIRLDGNNAVLTFIDGSTMTADMRLVTLTMSYSETTGVSSLHMTDKDGNVSIYDLQGRKVDNSKKPKTNGIVIVNGKKVVNKK
jgi:hypothetical protein